mgnify:CR=1 FL=1
MIIICSDIADKQIDDIYCNKNIYDPYGHFTQQFLNWNREFHRYVNPMAMNSHIDAIEGIYTIGRIGTLMYNSFNLNGVQVFEIIEFNFTKLPYTKRDPKYNVIFDANYGYNIIQSTSNNLYAILKPNHKPLTKYAFDNIIGFHHSSNDYKTIYAIGFIGNRVYAIYPNGDINILPYSKEEYLTMKHKYYENKRYYKRLLNENTIRRITTKVINRILNLR